MGTQSTWATCVRYINTTNTNTTNKRTNNAMNTMRLSKSVNVASKTVQRSRPAVVAVRAVNLPFGLGGSKTAAPKKTAGGRGSQKVTTRDPAAQSFVIRIPGQFFQSKKDVVWPISLGFTNANELFVGRMAMLGFAASLIGEIMTGKGALAQFDTEPLVLGLIAFNLFAAFAPGKGKFIPDREESTSRKAGSLQDPKISLATPGKFFGISGPGFTKENELFVGRVAQLGFAASLIGEAITGQGPLAQFNLETGIPLADAEPALLFSIVLLGLTAVNEGTGKFVDDE